MIQDRIILCRKHAYAAQFQANRGERAPASGSVEKTGHSSHWQREARAEDASRDETWFV